MYKLVLYIIQWSMEGYHGGWKPSVKAIKYKPHLLALEDGRYIYYVPPPNCKETTSSGARGINLQSSVTTYTEGREQSTSSKPAPVISKREESRILLPYALVPHKVTEADYKDLKPNLYATPEEELMQHSMFQGSRCYHYNCIFPPNRDWKHTHLSGRFALLGKRVKIWPEYEEPICYKFQEGGATCKENCLCRQSM